MGAHSPSPVHGLIFLFKWRDQNEPRECLQEIPESLFFARQVLVNSCATQALLAILLNRPEIEVGPHLQDLRSFTAGMAPKQKGEAIGNSEVLRVAHNSFAKQEYFQISHKRAATRDDDVYHFISYVPHGGVLYELDGLQTGPIALGTLEGPDWVPLARAAIQARIDKYAAEEIRFSLLALVGDQRARCRQQAARARALLAAGRERLGWEQAGQGDYALTEEDLAEVPSEVEALEAACSQWEEQAGQWEQMEAGEAEKRERWKVRVCEAARK